jgi:hypothetical protein
MKKWLIIFVASFVVALIGLGIDIATFQSKFCQPWKDAEQSIPMFLETRCLVSGFAVVGSVLLMGIFVCFLIINPATAFFKIIRKSLGVLIILGFLVAVVPWFLPSVEPSLSEQILSSLSPEQKAYYSKAHKGDPEAETHLGYLLINGENDDLRKYGLIWLLAAANNHNYAPSEAVLGSYFQKGKYVQKNYEIAFNLLNRAISHGYKDAIAVRDNNPKYRFNIASEKLIMLPVIPDNLITPEQREEQNRLQHECDVALEELKSVPTHITGSYNDLCRNY